MTLEKAINGLIKNGHRIEERGLGTVLPTKASMEAGERHYTKMVRLNAKFAANALRGCERRVIGGEVRYYEDATHYAVVSNEKAKWFEVRADGDYPVKR